MSIAGTAFFLGFCFVEVAALPSSVPHKEKTGKYVNSESHSVPFRKV